MMKRPSFVRSFSPLCARPFGLRWVALGLGCCLGLIAVLDAQFSHASAQQTEQKPPVQKKQPRRTSTRRTAQYVKKLENLFVPPKGNAPRTTANSATRASLKCLPRESAIEAWGPPSGYGLSALERPAITLSLPSTIAQQVALLFRSESGEMTHQVFLPIPAAPAAQTIAGAESVTPSPRRIQFQLPSSQPGLLPGQLYRWSIVVVCGDSIEPDDPTFMGWVEYREPTLQEAQALAELSPPEKLHWYAQRGYWYDMVLE